MKWGWLTAFLLFGITCTAQKVGDSTELSPKRFQFNQSGFITNRSLISFEDNPALAGFDRKFNAAYSYKAQNIGFGNRFRVHSGMMDIAFGGDKQNWGAGVAYKHVKEGSFVYHQVIHAHSARAQIGNHNLLFGVKGGVAISNLEWDYLTFPDMVDPRFGFIYPTNEVKPASTDYIVAIVGTGLRYYWNRLSFDYSYEYRAAQKYTLNVPSLENTHLHVLKTAYHFKLGKTVNLTPEFLLFNNKYSKWNFTPAISVSFKNHAFAQFAFYHLNQMRIKLGYQFRELIAMTISCSTYLSEETNQALGIASVEGGVRIQLKTLRK